MCLEFLVAILSFFPRSTRVGRREQLVNENGRVIPRDRNSGPEEWPARMEMVVLIPVIMYSPSARLILSIASRRLWP